MNRPVKPVGNAGGGRVGEGERGRAGVKGNPVGQVGGGQDGVAVTRHPGDRELELVVGVTPALSVAVAESKTCKTAGALFVEPAWH